MQVENVDFPSVYKLLSYSSLSTDIQNIVKPDFCIDNLNHTARFINPCYQPGHFHILPIAEINNRHHFTFV